jgi:hypothetical protein
MLCMISVILSPFQNLSRFSQISSKSRSLKSRTTFSELPWKYLWLEGRNSETHRHPLSCTFPTLSRTSLSHIAQVDALHLFPRRPALQSPTRSASRFAVLLSHSPSCSSSPFSFPFPTHGLLRSTERIEVKNQILLRQSQICGRWWWIHGRRWWIRSPTISLPCSSREKGRARFTPYDASGHGLRMLPPMLHDGLGGELHVAHEAGSDAFLARSMKRPPRLHPRWPPNSGESRILVKGMSYQIVFCELPMDLS